jgi:hypothetical protein
MSMEVDYYDVRNAQETAERNARVYTDNEVATLRAAIDELREELASMWRALNSRTEHLA